MDIFITGGTGFIGVPLCEFLIEQQHQLTLLSRDPSAAREQFGGAVAVVSSPAAVSELSCDAVINLAGLPIVDRRWTTARQTALFQSRVGLTTALIDALARAGHPPKMLLSASAIGYYGDQGERWVDEDTEPRMDYAHQLCDAWEQAAMRAQVLGIRVCVLRLGLVIGAGGGFIKRILVPFKLGLGGQLGSGQQWMSWVHRQDVLRMMMYLVEHATLQGVFNGTSPRPVRNAEFTRILARQLHRPADFAVPAFALQLAMGEMSSLLLGGQRVAPSRLLDAGFEFSYENLDSALQEVLS